MLLRIDLDVLVSVHDVDCFDGLVIYFPNDIERERFIFNAEIDRLSRRPL